MAVFAIIVLGHEIGTLEIATAYTDPISRIRAQDESVYASSSLRMASEGEWVTPRFLGRLLLYKPPLLIWLSALSVKIFGESPAALRAPALLAGVLATLVLFLWVKRVRSSWAGWAVVLLLISNPLWNVFSRLCYTDMIFTASVVGGLFATLVDPPLARLRTRVLFIVCCGAAILAKNVAGLLPPLIWILALLVSGRTAWPRAARLAQVAAGVLLVALPWHLYQAVVHSQWFWADYVQVQLLGFGLTPPAQTSGENNLAFYGKRIFLTDPFLVLFALIAIPALWRDLRERKSPAAILLVCWIGVMGAALMGFRYRNLPYALNLIPPLAVLGALYAPGGVWRVPVLCAVFAIKILLPGAPFGLPARTPEPIPSVESMREYARMARPNELIFVSPDDEFYSSTLPLPRIRYAFLDPGGVVVRYAPHFAYLGITVTVEQFLQRDELRKHFVQRLHEWGVATAEPLGTAIVAGTEADLVRLAASCPYSDFFLPSPMLQHLESAIRQTHRVVPAGHGRVFLLALETYAAQAPGEGSSD